MLPTRLAITLGVCALLASCSTPKQPSDFAGTTPSFDPLTYWTGHTHSWGVVENRDGAPSEIVQTDCIGELEGRDALHMRQTLTEGDGTVTHRDWHLRRLAPGRFSATANDMAGTAEGTASGRVFHWRWVWAESRPAAVQCHDVPMDVRHAGRHDDEPHDGIQTGCDCGRDQ